MPASFGLQAPQQLLAAAVGDADLDLGRAGEGRTRPQIEILSPWRLTDERQPEGVVGGLLGAVRRSAARLEAAVACPGTFRGCRRAAGTGRS